MGYKVADDDSDVFHFIAYVPHYGTNHVYELDGLQQGPISCGSFTNGNWLDVARKAIQERIENYAASEIKFNLMAVVKDKRLSLNQKLASLALAGISSEEDSEIMHIRTLLLEEEEKRNHWEIENARRRHNYLPFCVELLKALAREDKLKDVVEKA